MVKRVYVYNCSVCGKPGAESVPCGYCKEQLGGEIKQSHMLCEKCFMLGCPVAVFVTKNKILSHD